MKIKTLLLRLFNIYVCSIIENCLLETHSKNQAEEAFFTQRAILCSYEANSESKSFFVSSQHLGLIRASGGARIQVQHGLESRQESQESNCQIRANGLSQLERKELSFY